MAENLLVLGTGSAMVGDSHMFMTFYAPTNREKLSDPEKEASGMLDAKLRRRLEALAKVSQAGKKVQGLFKIMRSQASLWLQAYANIYANKGAVTPGVNRNTLDGFSDERVINIIHLLEEDRYHFQPSQRVSIPKAHGKLRP
jgi:hypothetical protein